MATIIRGAAQAVAFSVCTNSVGTFFFAFPFLLSDPLVSSSFEAGLYLISIFQIGVQSVFKYQHKEHGASVERTQSQLR